MSYASKISEGVEGAINSVVFKGDGEKDRLFQLHSAKLLNNGIFFLVVAIPESSINPNAIRQCEIVISSLSNI
ncbi:hypothetical protein P6N53_07965 [Desulforamulus aquiferis]|uniref:Uncharacterized protein n=1 Tax=Desulforamulus aquiferis TaxID=1397668 RepID=A0AAW7ZCU1_9FIRM|nr:hypothetical protein [Desulforamulus aquiferis]MDO7787151.1 hypothetical protein [Desulforamulus aquiferis]RYD04837.1 hypothetical protein N752_12995 [Desulforamulus aquiferis]